MANSYSGWARSLHPPLGWRSSNTVSSERWLRGWRPEGLKREGTPDKAGKGKGAPGKARCVMLSEMVDSAVTADFSVGGSVVMNGRILSGARLLGFVSPPSHSVTIMLRS